MKNNDIGVKANTQREVKKNGGSVDVESELQRAIMATSSIFIMRVRMDASMRTKSRSKKPKYSRFTQQELPAWKPIFTPKWIITSFVIIAILFTPAGLVCLWASEHVVEIIDRYDDDCLPDAYSTNPELFIQSNNTNKTCVRTLKVPRKMTAPIFIYYQLDNFYQNHRRYVKSRSDKQLRDHDEGSETEDCKPIDNLNGEPVVPCGLVAWSLFNDTYNFYKGNKVIDIDKKDIAWESDKKFKFGSNVYPKNFQKGELVGGGQLDESKPLSEQEDLIVWMKTAALPIFRKLYGKINTDLEANETITVVIQNNYNTYEFGGEKKVALSTANWIGGKNDFFGISFLTVGGVCFFVAIGFILLYVLKPRPLGDPTYLSWNRNQGSH